MSSKSKPEICPKWWASEKPSDIKGQDLKKALTEAQQSLTIADKKGDADSIENGLGALGSLGSAANKTIKKECDKRKHKELIDVLEQLEALVNKEIERLEKAKAELAKCNDGEDADPDAEDKKGKLFQPEHLVKMIKQLKSGNELRFSFGIDKNAPEKSCLLLCPKREPERLFKMLKSKSEFANRLMTYGFAKADGKTMQFKLADKAKEPSQICKLAKVYLKKNPELKFKKLLVICDGKNYEEDMDAGETKPGALKQELERAQALVSAWSDALKSVSDQINALIQRLKKETDPALLSVGEGLATVMDQFPDLDLGRLVDAAKSDDRVAYNDTLANTMKEVQDVHNLLDKGPLLSTIDSNPLVVTNVHETVNTVLKRITDELQITA